MKNNKTQRSSDKYKNVYFANMISGRDYKNKEDDGVTKRWYGLITIKGKPSKKFFFTEREAALWVDKKLIEEGKEPINILKRK